MGLFGQSKTATEAKPLPSEAVNPEELSATDERSAETSSSEPLNADLPVDSGASLENEQPLSCEPSETESLAVLIGGLEARLLAAFDQKISVDRHKEKQIDRLHEQLQEYKSDLVAKATKPMAGALIKVHSDAERIIASIAEVDPAKLTVERVAAMFSSFREGVEMALGEQGVEPFRADAGSRFDPKRQAAVKDIPAPSPELTGTVAQSLASGFEYAGHVLEREKVTVYSAAAINM